nr:arginase family protein [Pseudorhodoplanes sinuspersici]
MSELADAVEEILNAAEFPVVLGGDCTILLGSMLALLRRGRYVLFFIDGHADFFRRRPNQMLRAHPWSWPSSPVTGRHC